MYGLHDQTIYLCANYLDRYVSSHIVPRSSLQLVGVTCLQIASKYSEVPIIPLILILILMLHAFSTAFDASSPVLQVSCPTGEQFAYISVTPIGEIMKMERKILESLSYRLTLSLSLSLSQMLTLIIKPNTNPNNRLCVVSGLDFCAHYCRVCGASDITSMLARVTRFVQFSNLYFCIYLLDSNYERRRMHLTTAAFQLVFNKSSYLFAVLLTVFPRADTSGV